MGIFSKPSRAESQQSATTLIAKGCSITGQLKLESDLQVDGSVEGQINAEKTLVISETGMVSGEIFADRVLVNGRFEGKCYAASIEILSKGKVSGTLYTDDLSIEQGGKFLGETLASPDKQVVDLQGAKTKVEG
ncbi:polymer-forming cytoskeletal protein [Vibrio sp. S4M6]|uniref:bactofilin family protein n=1 Tax=Vibrio sinus TaxID=2946865 RepID=UPI00202A08A3|nr:polymer-forming cytoskeletal protein [Vibrio sinus]MCL9781761.1 polymer-forming cytoskeletal protein [Vibrio sinus]